MGVRIKAAFNLSNEQFGWVLAAFALAYAIFEIPSGMLGDRIGQKESFIRIVIWWSLFTALTGATTGLITLLCTRFLFGMGEAGAFPNSSAVISRWFPAAETGRAGSSLLVGTNAGAAIAPLIIVPIAANFGWRTPFFVIGLIGVLWVLVCIYWFRNEPSQMRGISKEEESWIESNRKFIKNHQRLSLKQSLNNSCLWSLVSAYFTNQFAFYFFVAWMPIYLQEGRHLTESGMKNVTSVVYIFGILGALLSGFMNDRLARLKTVLFSRRFIGCFSHTLAAICFLVASRAAVNELAVCCLVAANFFIVINTVTCFTVCIDIAGNKAGTVVGMMNFCGQTGAFMVALTVGKTVQTTHNFDYALTIISSVLFGGCLLWLVVDPRKQFCRFRELADDSSSLPGKPSIQP